MDTHSHLLGQFVATTHLMESVFLTDEKTFAEENLNQFRSNPTKFLPTFEKEAIKWQLKLEEIGKTTILNEILRIFSEMEQFSFNDNSARQLNFNPTEFDNGYDLQMRWSKYVRI